jgi:ribosomal protein L37E
LLQDEEPGSSIKTDEEISQIVIQHLGPILRRKSVASLMDPSALIELESILNGSLSRDFQGYISDIKVVDIRTENEDWFFKVDALIKEELRKIETETQLLAIDESKADFDEAKFTVALRRIKQGESEELALRKSALQAKMNLSELDIEEHALDTKTDLRKEGIDSVAEKERMVRDRELNRDRVSGEREDEISDVDHKLNLDKKVATHDIDMNDLTGEAQSRSVRRVKSDEIFGLEEALRLKTQEKEAQLKRVQEMRLQQMMAAKQDQEFELAKAQSMKGMSAQEILAMQAAQLVKAGATNAADKIAESLGNAAQLKVQEEANQKAIDAYKSAAEMALKASENMAKVTGAAATTSNEGYKEAAKIAQTTNEKSMESMSKVATAAAGKKSGKDDKDQKDDDDEWECTECGKVSITKPGKHCTKCGHKRPTDD